MPKFFGFDTSAPPTARERAVLEGRLDRLAASAASVGVANRHFTSMRADRAVDEFRLRHGYVYGDWATEDFSDLRQPPPEQCPPAGSLVRSRGGLLRFHLLALAEAQLRTQVGKVPRNDRPLVATDECPVGWTDLFASDAVASGGGRTYQTARDKRLRAIKQALDSLAVDERRLVVLPNRSRGAGKHEGFLLLDEEVGRASDEDPLPYRVPVAAPGKSFALPMSFITSGWAHVLEDTEISVLLMIACGRQSIATSAVAIRADVRVTKYGIGRDRFESHRWLERFGLIEVEEMERRADGKARDFEDQGAFLHRLSLKPEAFEVDAVDRVRAALEQRKAR